MCSEDLEAMLSGLPVRALAPAAESQMLSTLLATQPAARRWWERRVPMWQAAVACLLLAGVAGLLSRAAWPHRMEGIPAGQEPQPVQAAGPPPLTIVLEPAAPLFAHVDSRCTTDVRRWQVLATATQGDLR